MILEIVNVAGRRNFNILSLFSFIPIWFSFGMGQEEDNEEKKIGLRHAVVVAVVTLSTVLLSVFLIGAKST